MLDMGFMPALNQIVAELPRERQSLFFSATLPPKIRSLASKLLFNPVRIDVAPKSTSVEKIEQTVRFVQRTDKLTSLQEVLRGTDVDRAIVFTRTKHGADALTKKLGREGISAVAIHGNKAQNARRKALESFRRNNNTVLVATDVAARGIDVAGVTHVINYDMPVEPESYVHRIGRTGRAGATGIAVSFCTAEEQGELRAIEKLTGKSLTIQNPEADFRVADSKTKRKTKTRKPWRSKSKSGNSRSTQQCLQPGRGKKPRKLVANSRPRAAAV